MDIDVGSGINIEVSKQRATDYLLGRETSVYVSYKIAEDFLKLEKLYRSLEALKADLESAVLKINDDPRMIDEAIRIASI